MSTSIKHPGFAVGGIVILALACSEPPAAKPTEKSTDEDGQHFLAEKPLKLFKDKDSNRWKHLEALGRAEKRAAAYKDRHSAVADPTSPDPLRGKILSLEEALAGLEGQGAPKATIETTMGTITCELLVDEVPDAVAHFVGLARGLRPWWDGTVGKWSNEPFYRTIPVYKVTPNDTFYSGCPMGVGFAEVGFRAMVNMDKYGPVPEALTLAMFAGDRLPTLGAQFLVTAKPNAHVSEKTLPIGKCEGTNVVQKIVNQAVTSKGIPVTDTAVREVTITR